MSATTTRPADASVQVDASVKTEAPVEPKAPKAQPKAPETPKTPSPDAEVSEYKPMEPWQLIPRGEVGVNWSSNGQRDGGLFDSSFGSTGDFVNKHVAFGLLTNANGGKVQFRFGGMLNWDWQTGNDLTFGSTFHHGTLGPVAELNFREAWRGVTGQTFAPLAYLGLGAGLGVGHGTGTLNDGLLHTQTGLASYFNAYLNVATLSIGDLQMGLNLDYRNTHINGPGDGTNWPVANGFGASLHFEPSFRQEKEKPPVIISQPEPKIIEKCDNWKELIAERKAEIEGKDGQPGLLQKVADAEKEVQKLRVHIETREVDPLKVEQVRDVLREQMVARLVQEAAPKDEAAIKTETAKAEIKAAESYPDNYNHWETIGAMPEESQLKVPDPLPENCEELEEIYKRLTEGRDGLDQRLADLDRLRRTPFPPRIREVVKEVIEKIQPNLKDVHFENARPTPWEIKQTITAVENTKTGSDGKPDWNSQPARNRLVAIFGRTYVDKALKALQDTADALNGDVMKKFNDVEIQGHTSTSGTDASNQTLSQRRADLVKAILVRMGVQSSRLKANGYGETKLKNPAENDKSASPGERAAAADENRRIEIHVSDGEITRVIDEEAKKQPPVTVTVPAEKAPPAGKQPAPKAPAPKSPKPRKVPPTDFE